jgi:hypothetical protein
MTAIRWVAFVLALITLGGLTVTPRSPASVLLAGLFFISFAVVCWTYGAFERNRP